MNWQDEIRTALKSSREIGSFFEFKDLISIDQYPSFIPLKFAEHMKRSKSSALINQFIVSQAELKSPGGFEDPIGDSKNAVNGGIIHRYKNRVLFSPTTNCPINCRYCFRKNELHTSNPIFKASLETLKNYLIENDQINEVILTGGDPFFISNNKIKEIIQTVDGIESIKYLRFHTRFPIIIPSRFDDELLEILQSSSKKIVIAIHCNHEDEFNTENIACIQSFRRLSFSLISQTVLLKNINDSSNDLIKLFTKFDEIGIRPYYLHHPDQVKGAMSFYLSIEQGRQIYSELRKELSGWLIPHYVVDNNLGRGKQFAFNPESIKFSGYMLDMSNDYINFM